MKNNRNIKCRAKVYVLSALMIVAAACCMALLAGPSVAAETVSGEAGRISGFLWQDQNENGIWEKLPDCDGNHVEDGYLHEGEYQECALSGFLVSLYLADDLTASVANVNTSGDGSYTFEDLADGVYKVGVTMAMLGDTEYLMPLSGRANDNKFVIADDYLNAFSEEIVISGGNEVTGISAGMRLPPGIQSTAYPQYNYHVSLSGITGSLRNASGGAATASVSMIYSISGGTNVIGGGAVGLTSGNIPITVSNGSFSCGISHTMSAPNLLNGLTVTYTLSISGLSNVAYSGSHKATRSLPGSEQMLYSGNVSTSMSWTISLSGKTERNGLPDGYNIEPFGYTRGAITLANAVYQERLPNTFIQYYRNLNNVQIRGNLSNSVLTGGSFTYTNPDSTQATLNNVDSGIIANQYYKYRGYSTNGTVNTSGAKPNNISNVTAGATVYFYYELDNTAVNIKYLDVKTSEVLANDLAVNYPKSATPNITVSPPGIAGYCPVRITKDGISTVEYSGSPITSYSTPSVLGEIDIVIYYATDSDGNGKPDYSVIQKYQDKNGDPIAGRSDIKTTYEVPGNISAGVAASFTPDIPVVDGYKYSGYRLNGGNFISAVPPSYTDKTIYGDEVYAYIYLSMTIANAEIGDIDDLTYIGSGQEPPIAVTFAGEPLIEDVDYEIIGYFGNINAGQAYVEISGKGEYYDSLNTLKKYFTIKPKTLTYADLTVTGLTSVYDGGAKTVTATYNGESNFISFIIEYFNGTEYVSTPCFIGAGNYTVRISLPNDEDNYTFASEVKTASITAQEITEADITGGLLLIDDIPAETYTGYAVKPAPLVMYKGETLVEHRDFEYDYSDNIYVGTDAGVTVNLKGNYSGSVTVKFEIKKATAVINAADKTLTFNGVSQGIDAPVTDPAGLTGIIVTYAGSGDTVYSPSTTAPTDAGTYSVTVILNNANYEAAPVTAWLTIEAAELINADISIVIEPPTYTGGLLTPAPLVYDGSKLLTEGTDYIVLEYSNNIAAGVGTATVTIQGKGDYSGTFGASFTILKAEAVISADNLTVTYKAGTPREITPSINPDALEGLTVTYRDINGTDTSDTAPTNAGEYEVIITLNNTNYYAEPVTVRLTILTSSLKHAGTGDDADIRVVIASQTYNGSALMPVPEVWDGDTQLSEGHDYEFLTAENYTNNINAGIAWVRISGKGNYDDWVDIYFTVNTAAMTVTAPAYTASYTGAAHTEFGITAVMVGQSQEYDIKYKLGAEDDYGDGLPQIKTAGTYTLYFMITADNHTVYEGSITVRINRAVGNGTVLLSDWEYGSPNDPDFNTTMDGTASAVQYLYVGTGDTYYSESSARPVNAGTYEIKAYVPESVNYSEYYSLPVSFNITVKGGITDEGDLEEYGITVDPIPSRTYNGNQHTPEVVVKEGGTLLVKDVDYTVAYSNNTNVGTAAVTITFIKNFGGSVTVGFMINAATITGVTVTGGVYTYDGEAKKVAVGGTLIGDVITYRLGEEGGFVSGNPEFTDADEYTVYVRIERTGHKTVTLSAVIKINPADPSDPYIKDPLYAEPSIGSMEYDPNRILANIFLPTGWTWDNDGQIPTVGNGGYYATYTPQSGNYTSKNMLVAVPVTKKQLTAPVASGSTSLAYSGTEQTLEITGYESGTMGIVGNKGKKADSYTAVITLEDSANYCWTGGSIDNITIPWSITRVTLTVKANDETVRYGDPVPQFNYTVTGFKNGENKDVISGLFGLSTDAQQFDPVGTYMIFIEKGSADAENYEFDLQNGTLIANKAIPSAVTTPLATAQLTYGAMLTSWTLTAGWEWENDSIKPTVTNGGYYAKLIADYVNYDYTGAVGYDSDTQTVRINVAVTVLKATPAFTLPTLGAVTYSPSRKLSDIALPSGWAWDSLNTVPTVNVTSYSATYTPDDMDNYKTVIETISLTVNKADPTYTLPTPAAVTYSATQRLSMIVLGSGWTWDSPNETPTVINGGYSATFTPADTVNYNTVTKTVQLTVNKAPAPSELTETPDTGDGQDYGSKLNDWELPGEWQWNDKDKDKIPGYKDTEYEVVIDVSDYDDNYDFSGVDGYDSGTHTVRRLATIKVNVPKGQQSAFFWLMLLLMVAILGALIILCVLIKKKNRNDGIAMKEYLDKQRASEKGGAQ